ncbi:hypothetical protein [Nocardia sp. NPDC060249]|uniref:hypothetical protein n=1 Tax=Nocardia sp. NPDC060249 TaxID=3347082 RepID=UPI003654311F
MATTTVAELEQTVAGLRGQRLTAVTYYTLPVLIDDDTYRPEKWDYGEWHEATMGIELATDTGQLYSAVWNSSFTQYHLEVFPRPISEFIRIAEDGPAPVPMATHPRWAPLIGEPISHADLCWYRDFQPGLHVPAAVRISVGSHTIWLASGRSEPAGTPSFYNLTDDVMVVFTADIAQRKRILE